MVRQALFYPPLIGMSCSEIGPSPPVFCPIGATHQKMVRATGLEPEQGCPH